MTQRAPRTFVLCSAALLLGLLSVPSPISADAQAAAVVQPTGCRGTDYGFGGNADASCDYKCGGNRYHVISALTDGGTAYGGTDCGGTLCVPTLEGCYGFSFGTDWNTAAICEAHVRSTIVFVWLVVQCYSFTPCDDTCNAASFQLPTSGRVFDLAAEPPLSEARPGDSYCFAADRCTTIGPDSVTIIVHDGARQVVRCEAGECLAV